MAITADFSPVWLSLETSITATAITLVLGAAAAVWRANRRGAGPALLDGIFLLPLVLPPTVVGFILLLIFGRNGPLGRLLMHFGASVVFYMEQRRSGARVEFLKSEDGLHIPLERVLDAIDDTTLLVPISLVLFRSATLIDAKAIIERAHKFGAHVILDCFQAAGTVPFDVRKLQTDFAVGGVLKWLCGGPGVSYLYVRPDLRTRLSPRISGWLAHKRPFNFEAAPLDSRDDSYRFLNGTPHIPALYACQPGLDIVRKVGVNAIRDKSVRQTAGLIEGALRRGWRVNSPRDSSERGGTVSIECPHAQEVKNELIARDILVDYRPGAGIRISPHFYNADEEVDFSIARIDEILATRAWERHLQPA